jgi:hypothetical protein
MDKRRSGWRALSQRVAAAAHSRKSERFRLQLVQLQPPFVEVNEFEHCLHGAGRQADFGETLIQSLRARVTPTALGHETVPHLKLLLIWPAAMLKCPFEQLCISFIAFESFGLERRVINLKKAAAA